MKELEKKNNELHLGCSIKHAEISKAIAKLKNNKSSGIDHICNEMLKAGQLYLLPSLHKLFNACLNQETYPKLWAQGLITPIYKADDPNNPNNYRDITVTSVIGKLFNSILNTRLQDYLKEHSVIDTSQIGFTKNARTSDHMFILKCLIDNYFSQNKKTVHVFYRFQKSIP